MLERHNVPAWVRPYVYKYVRKHPISAVIHAKSFIEVHRKRGEVTGKYVRLPNGIKFDKQMICHLVSIFFNSEERVRKVNEGWLRDAGAAHEKYVAYLEREIDAEAARVRALKNLAEGLNVRLEKRSENIEQVYDYLESLTDWMERIVATNILLRYAYSNSFGFVFYKVLYPASPELMRAIGKAFKESENTRWGEQEARRIISSGELAHDRLVSLAEQVLARVWLSVDAELTMAKKAHIGAEVQLLGEVAVAYPLHIMQELGVQIDIEAELMRIKGIAAELMRRQDG